MAKLHVEDGGNGQYRIVVHGPVMAGNNSAGISWSTAIVTSGRNVTSMTVGTGPGQISAAEAASIANGTVIEADITFTEDPDQSPAERNAELDLIAANALSNLAERLRTELKWFGADQDMSTASPIYGTATAMTITLASLAASLTAGRESTAINSVTDDCLDYECGGFITSGTSPTNNGIIEVWVYGSYDGTTYTGGATGTDAALTPVSKSLMRLGYSILVTSTSNVRYPFHLGGIANMFGGLLPSKWGVFVANNSGQPLNATAGNHEFKYRTIKFESN